MVSIKGAGTANIIVSVTGASNYTTPTAQTIAVTIGKAAAQTMSDGNSTYTYSTGSKGNIEEVLVNALIPVDAVTTGYSVVETDNDNILTNAAIEAATGKLTYQVPELQSSAIGKTAQLTVTITSENYQDMTYIRKVEITDQSGKRNGSE